MSIEVIKSIKLTEHEAERIEKQSIADSREIISEAKKEAYKLIEQIVQEAEENAKKIAQKAEEEARKEIEEMNKIVHQECKEIKYQAEKNIDSAVDVIMRRVVNASVNS